MACSGSRAGEERETVAQSLVPSVRGKGAYVRGDEAKEAAAVT